ncbi:LOW QUALITY PROTEIN: 5'-3' exoribonuclease 1 [Odontesthes bonariensis]
MGVPKFYRWISERYPCLSEVVKEHQIPEFDNLYLDMNGIIHQCSHPNDEDVHFRISEEKIFADIFHYLEVLFRIIKPRKVFFMAVDGVAPRAKMNQQRGRRFRSAKEAEDKIKKALDKGEVLPTEARFDSNCITPGTDFMARLQEQLKYFVHNKLSTDKLWQNVNVYLSGHETPGEGEHKIMEFIRSENSKPNHNPNTRHCLYGLDADLIMLGLTSHEPHFSLLREEVRFGGKKSQKRITAPEETTFHLLHLSLMREYIDYEFSGLKNHLGSDYDLERIIDDWILMGFLVGNDFIPHLPHLHINHDALPLLYKTYISVLPSVGGYLNENGHLNLRNFEKYLEKLAEHNNKQGNRSSPSKGPNPETTAKEGLLQQGKNQAVPAGGIRLLKKNEDANSLFPSQNPANKSSNEFEDLLASLNISKSQQTPPPSAPQQEPNSQSDGPLSPQSFAMKGTMVLKEMLKIDGGGKGSPSPQETANATLAAGQQQNRRRSSKKLAAKMNAPHSDTAALPSPSSAGSANAALSSKVSDLAYVCVGMGMAPPDFSFIRNRQGLVVCQVKLSNGLMVHGPQCQSENEAKERAAFFALQRLNSVGSGFPLPPPLSGLGQIRPPPIRAMTPVFNQQGGLMLPHQGYAPAPMWGMTMPPHHHHPNQQFYGAAGTFPGAARPQPANPLPIGSHNQFIPLQVTKKRVSANKKNQETREFYSAAHTVAKNQSHRVQNSGQSQSQSQPHQHDASSDPSSSNPGSAGSVSTTTAAPHTPPRQSVPASGHTPGSASKRKHRKLAVNFEAAKVSE